LRWLSRGIAATALSATITGALPAQAAPWAGNRFQFANQSFQNLWNETDANPGDRSLTWGPRPWFDYKEFYKQSPNGLRQVQYFDKSRMEINNPSAPQSRFFVTNGLLPVEMVSGRVKLGNGTGADENDQREPAAIPVAGDLPKVNPDAPTYASFRLVATTNNDNFAQPALGQRVSATFDKNGNIGARPDLAIAGTEIVAFNAVTHHNVPAIFKSYQDFYDRPGGVTALFAFGLPITEPYWVRARVAGQEKDVMVQIYERRVLTFTPSNPEQYKVEMGNVGQHYFQWRYPNLGTPWDASDPYLPIAFGSSRATPSTPNRLQLYTTDQNGAGQNPITATNGESFAFSMLRSWDQSKVRIIGDSTRDGGKRQLYSFALDGSVQQRILQSNFNDYNGAVSPDGSKVAFASDRDGNTEIWLLNLSGGGLTQLTTTSGTCVNEYPSWYPDGSALAYNSNCSGNWEIFRADLRYEQDKANEIKASLVNPVNLTNNAAADRYGRVNPAGTHIAFRSDRDGNGEIYIMSAATGTALRRLTNSSNGDDSAPSWSPNGAQIVYDSNVEGDYELYIRNFDGAGGPRQITDNGANDRWAIWAQ
jgi:Tol biopolymer transport system component